MSDDDTQEPLAPVTALPQNFNLDLDDYERPAEDIIPAFTVKLGGKVITMTNPDELNWQDLLDIRDPVDFLRHSCSREDRLHILGLNLPAFKMSKLMDTYMTHFRVDERMDAVRRAERARGF